jgi:hypothetical protein
MRTRFDVVFETAFIESLVDQMLSVSHHSAVRKQAVHVSRMSFD